MDQVQVFPKQVFFRTHLECCSFRGQMGPFEHPGFSIEATGEKKNLNEGSQHKI